MPEITDAEFRQFVRYQSLGTPEELEKLPKKVSDLEADNKGYRDTIRDLKEKLPAEGMVAVPKEQAEALAKYEALGKPDEIEAAVKERETLKADLAMRERRDAIGAAVKALGWPEDVIATIEDMKSLDGAKFEVRTETVDGEEVQVPYVTLPGEDASPQKLVEFAASAPQLKGLKTEAPKAEQSTPSFPPQPKSGDKPKPSDPVAAHIQRMEEAAKARTNPLLPQK